MKEWICVTDLWASNEAATAMNEVTSPPRCFPNRLPKCCVAVLLAGALAVPAVFASPSRAAAAPEAKDGGKASPKAGGGAGGIAAQPNKVRGDEITPEQQRAVERGLKWL